MTTKFQNLLNEWPINQSQVQLMPVDLAERFLIEKNLRTAEDRKLVHWRNDFYAFEQTHFKKISKDTFRSSVVSWMQKNPELRKYSKTTSVASVILNIEAISKIRDDVLLSTWLSDELIHLPNWINMKNGIFDLDGYVRGEQCFWEHSPKYFSTVCLPYELNVNAKCPTWIAFLERMQPDEGVRRVIQEWFGYNLILDTTEQKFVLFVGEGANGKTVFCVVLRTLLGECNVSAIGLEAFSATRTFPLAATVGKLANIVEELNEIDRTAEGELKKFVSGGLMTAEQKHRDPFEFRPSARLTFASNVLPRFSDRSDGLWRRLLLIPCNVQIKNERDQDKRLVDPKFWEQSGELPGIFNWALEGLVRLRRRGHIEEPLLCLEAKTGFKRDSNPAKLFLSDYCEFKIGTFVPSRTLYEKYTEYIKGNGQHPLSEPLFAKEVARVFPGAEKSKNAIRHEGVRGHIWNNIYLPN